jgi:hypothetical protein
MRQFDWPITKREKKTFEAPPLPPQWKLLFIYGGIYSKALWPAIWGKLWFIARKCVTNDFQTLSSIEHPIYILTLDFKSL